MARNPLAASLNPSPHSPTLPAAAQLSAPCRRAAAAATRTRQPPRSLLRHSYSPDAKAQRRRPDPGAAAPRSRGRRAAVAPAPLLQGLGTGQPADGPVRLRPAPGTADQRGAVL
jgi:hypothetical protein